jgi:hypothetical protein
VRSAPPAAPQALRHDGPRGCSTGSPYRPLRDGNSELSQVPGRPTPTSALPSDPGGTSSTRPVQYAGTAPAICTTKAPTTIFLSRLNSTAFVVAVYASRWGSPHHRARLASGCWPNSTRRDCSPVGPHWKVSGRVLSPFPRLCLAQANMKYIDLKNFITAVYLSKKGHYTSKMLFISPFYC